MSVAAQRRPNAAPLRDARAVLRARWPSLCVLAAVLWFSVPTLASLHDRWLGFGYSHGYLILLLSLVLVVKSIRREPLELIAPSFVGGAVLVLAALLVLAGHASTTTLFAQLALPLLWLGALWSLFGQRNLSRFALPLMFLYFAVPIWDAINGTLQSLTVVVVSLWVRSANIPAFIDGNMIHIPAGSFEVAGGCSGLHYLVVGLALSAYLGIANYSHWMPRLALFGLALATALLGNWIRVFSIIVAGHVTDMQHFLIVKDHYYFGWALFLVLCLVPVILVDRWLAVRVDDENPGDGRMGRRLAEVLNAGSLPSGNKFVVSLIALVLIASWAQARVFGTGGSLQRDLVIPDIAGWQVAANWEDGAVPVFEGSDDSFALRFASGLDFVDVFVASYARQVQGREVVYYANRPEGVVGDMSSSSEFQVSSLDGTSVPLVELKVTDSNERVRIVWYGRQIGGRWAVSDVEAKVWQVLGSVSGRQDALVFVMSANCRREDCDVARRSLHAFADQAIEQLLAPAMTGGSRHEAGG